MCLKAPRTTPVIKSSISGWKPQESVEYVCGAFQENKNDFTSPGHSLTDKSGESLSEKLTPLLNSHSNACKIPSSCLYSILNTHRRIAMHSAGAYSSWHNSVTWKRESPSHSAKSMCYPHWLGVTLLSESICVTIEMQPRKLSREQLCDLSSFYYSFMLWMFRFIRHKPLWAADICLKA